MLFVKKRGQPRKLGGTVVNKNLMLLLNPAAGGGKNISSLGPVLEVLYRGGYLPTVYYTTAPGEATQLILSHAQDYDVVACSGGDGTLSEVVAGLVQLRDPPPLGYLPHGTSNDVASSLGIPKTSVAAAKFMVRGRPTPIDVGLFNEGEYFTYIAAFGAFTEVSYETPREQKQSLGHFAYILQGLSKLPKLTHYHTVVELDNGRKIMDDLLFGSVSNTRAIGGMVRLKDNMVDLNDGHFEVMLVRDPGQGNVIELNKITTSILQGTFSSPYIRILRSSHVKFHFEQPVKWTRDGENGGAHQDVTLENLRSAYSILL
jgi:diacylglycerol kinase (ATP)